MRKNFQDVLDSAINQVKMLRQLGVMGLFFLEVDHFEDDGVVAVSDGKKYINVAGYSYLGISQRREISGAVAECASSLGVGSHGSRVIAGTNALHIRLEERLAEIHGKEACAVFNSGTAANLAAVSVLVGKGGIALVDELSHRSILDGARLAKGARVEKFKHNDTEDLKSKLEILLEEDRNILVVCEGVYSMDGDVAPIDDISHVCKTYDVPLMVDEAHSIGVVGATGGGVSEHFSLPPDAIDVKMGTMGKAMPGYGGFICGTREIVDAVRAQGASYFFSGALPAYVMAANLKSLEIAAESPHERMDKLRSSADSLRAKLNAEGLDTGDSQTCIIPVMVGDEMQCYGYAKLCLDKGLWAVPISWPAVPFGEARLRVSISASFTEEHIQKAADILVSAAKEFGVLD